MSPSNGTAALVRALRRRGHEAQFTQAIAAMAQTDPEWAAALLDDMVALAPADQKASLGVLPQSVSCLAEVNVAPFGRVDLAFRDQQDLVVLVELKLHSGYGLRQLGRYRDALDADTARRQALLAVTTTAPLAGEEDVAGDPRWLGSIRWRDLLPAMHALDHRDATATVAWRALLDVLADQGDFGPMNVDADAIHGWARRTEAEQQLRALLTGLVDRCLALVRTHAGTGPDDAQAASILFNGRSSQPIVPWRDRLHIRFAVPAAVKEPRLRVQFAAIGGRPYFTVEARYEHPKEQVDAESVRAATAALEGQGFSHGNDGVGWYWAQVVDPEQWMDGPATPERLQELAGASIAALSQSGIFAALAELTPSGPASDPPPESDATGD